MVKADPEPIACAIHNKIAMALCDEIRAGAYGEGTPFTSLTRIMDRFSISRRRAEEDGARGDAPGLRHIRCEAPAGHHSLLQRHRGRHPFEDSEEAQCERAEGRHGRRLRRRQARRRHDAAPHDDPSNQPCFDLATTAFQALFDRIGNPGLPTREILLDAPLVVRKLTKRRI